MINYGDISIRIIGDPSEILTAYLPNTIPDLYQRSDGTMGEYAEIFQESDACFSRSFSSKLETSS
jgi:hypothetical protein